MSDSPHVDVVIEDTKVLYTELKTIKFFFIRYQPDPRFISYRQTILDFFKDVDHNRRFYGWNEDAAESKNSPESVIKTINLYRENTPTLGNDTTAINALVHVFGGFVLQLVTKNLEKNNSFQNAYTALYRVANTTNDDPLIQLCMWLLDA